MPACFPLPRPRRLAPAAVFLMLCAASAAQADSIGGECRYDGETITFKDGVVFKEPNYFEKSKIDVIVALTTFALDKPALIKAEQKGAALSSQRFDSDDGRSVKLRISDGKVAGVDYNGGGTSVSASGGDIGTLDLKTSDATRVEARYVLEDEDKDDLNCTLSFNLAYATTTTAAGGGAAAAAAPKAASAQGKALPAGGGEPGKVFQANLAAMQKGDVDGMLATVSRQQAERMRAQKSDPKFGAMLEMMKSFAPKSATVTGGTDFGDSAELTIDAVDQSGATSSGTSKLVKEDGKWKVEKTSMKSKM